MFPCVVFFYAGLLVYRVSAGRLRLFEKGGIKSLSLYMAILIAIVTISFLSRGLYKIEEPNASKSISRTFCDIFSGPYLRVFRLVRFHHRKAPRGRLRPRSVTLRFLHLCPYMQAMGSHRVLPLTIFDEYYSYGDLLSTNIFTMFRGLIQDFGFIGSILFMLTTGLLLHWAFHAMLLKKIPVFTVAVFVFMMGYFYMSFGVSLLVSNSIYVTFFLVWVVLQLNKLITERGGRRLAPQNPPWVRCSVCGHSFHGLGHRTSQNN